MIDAREVAKHLHLPGPDEVETQRIGAEIVALVKAPTYDGRPIQINLPAGSDEEEAARVERISHAIRRRFRSKGWEVNLAPFTDESGQNFYSLLLSIDGAVLNGHSHTIATPSEPVTAPTGVARLPEKPIVSVLFGTYNRLALLKKAVASARSSVGSLTYEIVIVDGGSTDGSREWLAAQPDVLLICERRLEGAVRAFNQAFALCRGTFVANLNDDAAYEGDALEAAVRYLGEHRQCGQVAFAFFDKSQGKKTVNDIFPQEMFPEVTWGTTYANFGVARKTVIDAVARIQGGFWNPIYRTYAGDCEISAWIWRLGYTVDKLEEHSVRDVLVDDGLRESNSLDLIHDTETMHRRWPAVALQPNGPLPNITEVEKQRYEVERGRGMVAEDESAPASSDGMKHPVALASLFEDGHEERLVAVAPQLRALDPIEGHFPPRAETLTPERVLHVALVTESDPQAGLVAALKNWGKDSYDQIDWTEFPDGLSDNLVRSAKEISPTAIFMQLQQPDVVSPEAVRALRSIVPDAVIATWCGDIGSANSPWNLDWQVALGRQVDLTLHSSYAHVRALRAAGCHNAAYLQIGYDPEQYRPPLRAPGQMQVDKNGQPVALTPEDIAAFSMGDTRAKFRAYDVAFLGSNYTGQDAFSSSVRWHDGASRTEVVAKMKEAFGWKCQIYGRGWGKRDQTIPLHRAHEAYQRAKIGLSISLMNDLDCYSSDRLHRILGCGALALVKRFPMMSTWGLEHGVNCLVFDTAEEAVAFAKESVADPTTGDKIRAAGVALAREHLTWNVRTHELQVLVDAVRRARK